MLIEETHIEVYDKREKVTSSFYVFVLRLLAGRQQPKHNPQII